MKYKNLKVGLRVKVKNSAMVGGESDLHAGKFGVIIEFNRVSTFNVMVEFDDYTSSIFRHKDLKIIKEEN